MYIFRNKFCLTIFLLTTGLLLALLSTIYWHVLFPGQDNLITVEPPKPKQNSVSLAAQLGLIEWEIYTPQKSRSLAAERPFSVKALFEIKEPQRELHYVVAIKRAKNKKKNLRWEFFGGKVDHDSPLISMTRELAEEDPSLILMKIFQQGLEEKRQLQFRKITLKNGEQHLLFKVEVSMNEWLDLKKFWLQGTFKRKEVYDIFLASIELLDTRQSIKKKWTSKSRKLLSTLRDGDHGT